MSTSGNRPRGTSRHSNRVVCMVSSLGAVNGLIFTWARVYAKIGEDYSILSWMGGWSIAKGSPVVVLNRSTRPT